MASLNYIFLCPAWAPTNGGINAFNHDFCAALAERERVTCIAPNASDAEIVSAESLKIRLISLGISVCDFPEQIEHSIRTKLNVDSTVHSIWVGHDFKSGHVACACANLIGGTSVIFHHMDYSNYRSLVKQTEAQTRIKEQRKVLKDANLVFGVGPRLVRSAKRIRSGDLKTFELIPGLRFVTHTQPDLDYRIGIAGRLDLANDVIKQIQLAVKAAVRVLHRQSNGRGSINLIGALPEEIASIKSEIVEASNVAINSITYLADRAEFFEELEQNDVIVMPSLKEGFGLVAWEAVGSQIPVIASKASGFFELLERLELDSFVTSISVNGSTNETGESDDVNVLVSALECVFKNYASKKDRARLLRESLKNYTWQASADSFVKEIKRYVVDTSFLTATTDKLLQNTDENLLVPLVGNVIHFKYKCAGDVLPIYEEFNVVLLDNLQMNELVSRFALELRVEVSVSILDETDYQSLNLSNTNYIRDHLVEKATECVERRRSKLEARMNKCIGIVSANYLSVEAMSLKACLESLALNPHERHQNPRPVDIINKRTQTSFRAQIPNEVLDELASGMSIERPITTMHGLDLLHFAAKIVIIYIIPAFVISEELCNRELGEFCIGDWIWGES